MTHAPRGPGHNWNPACLLWESLALLVAALPLCTTSLSLLSWWPYFGCTRVEEVGGRGSWGHSRAVVLWHGLCEAGPLPTDDWKQLGTVWGPENLKERKWEVAPGTLS